MPDAASLERARRGWRCPVPLESYDRRPGLVAAESEALAAIAAGPVARWPTAADAVLQRLLRPINDVLAAVAVPPLYRPLPVRVLLQEMHARQSSYWAWPDTVWAEILTPRYRTFKQRYRYGDHPVRQHLMILAYFFAPPSDLSGYPLGSVSVVALARRIFGTETVDAAIDHVCALAAGWGYTSPHLRQQMGTALAEALLVNRSPHLEDLTLALLEDLAAKACAHTRHNLGRLSRALAAQGLIADHRPLGQRRGAVAERLKTEGIAPAWVDWCVRWHAASRLTEKTRTTYLLMLLRVGRWLARDHPEVTSPADWTTRLAAEYVAAVDQARIGDFVDLEHVRTLFPQAVGRPLSASSKDHQLAVLRAFFRDLQDDPFNLPRRLDPVRAFHTPRAIKRQIGPDPRDLDPLLWAKLVHAALHLAPEDLPHIGGRATGVPCYPLTLVRAVAAVWVYSGLRCNEIVRLPVGCIRWQHEDVTVPETGEILPRDAVCFLTVPVNKTARSYPKPVNPVVGQRIAAWERERAAHQPRLYDRKTGELVDYLFAHRGHPIGERYLNASVIPTLCAKAGIPPADERGRITSHRARATIATLIYNAPDGLSIWELMQWLGHRDPGSTQHYTRVTPTKLATAYTKADRTSRLVEALVDTQADGSGHVPVYYVLGDHGLCSNAEWASCLYRMACVKCPFFVPSAQARLIESRATIKRFLEIVDLTPDEEAAAQDDLTKIDATMARTQSLPLPVTLRQRIKDGTTAGVPLTLVAEGQLWSPGPVANGPERG